METETLKNALSYGMVVVDRRGRPLAPGDCVEYWRDLEPGAEESNRPDVVLGFWFSGDDGSPRVVSGFMIGERLQLIRLSASSLVKVGAPSPEYVGRVVAAALAEEAEGRQRYDSLIGFDDLRPPPLEGGPG